MANPLRGNAYIPNFSEVYFKRWGLFQTFRQGGGGSHRRVILGLALLNTVLLIIAIALGIKCARVKEGSLHVSHSAAVQLITGLEYLRGNHSDVIEAEEEAKKALETAVANHTRLKVKIEQQKSINDNYQKQLTMLQAEKTSLQSNISALEGTCGKCLPGWSLFNSSCYFFSYVESVKKNWPDSRADCVGRGADLVVIDNPQEQDFVSDSIKTMTSSSTSWTSGVWVGLTDLETEGKWVWINNVTEVEQRYWMYGEPNNHGLQGENCGIAVYESSSPWRTRYDGNCQKHELAWSCEMASK